MLGVHANAQRGGRNLNLHCTPKRKMKPKENVDEKKEKSESHMLMDTQEKRSENCITGYILE